ncbi:MAG: hypothetical protein SAK29_37390, partial [Scytonema sp. PMC 1069.18]|nr:hypothetical protein [Scytonema sp. PMC 1069.18]
MYSPVNFLTIEEYLKIEESSDIRHEYVDGQIFAMAGASEQHVSNFCKSYAVLRKNRKDADSILRRFWLDPPNPPCQGGL